MTHYKGDAIAIMKGMEAHTIDLIYRFFAVNFYLW